MQTLHDRFWSKVKRAAPSECWEWQASRHKKGYGQFGFYPRPAKSRTIRAHRACWLLVHGAIPDGVSVLHHCDNPACVNPAHLYLGSNDDNVRDRVARGRTRTGRRTSCPKGHAYTPENTLVRRSGLRLCRTCKNAASRRHYQRHSKRRCETARAWRQRNRDKVNGYSRAHYHANPEQARERNRRRYATNG